MSGGAGTELGDGIPLLGHAATTAVSRVNAEDEDVAPAGLGPEDLFLSHSWVLGRTRVTVRNQTLTVHQCAALQMTTARTWKLANLVPLPLLRSIDAVKVQPVFANDQRFICMCGFAAVLGTIVFLLTAFTAATWKYEGANAIEKPGGLTIVGLLLFVSGAAGAGGIAGLRAAGPNDGVLRALPAETAAMRTWTGQWAPAFFCCVFHAAAFIFTTWAGVERTRAPPFGAAPWMSFGASLMMAWLLFHGRTRMTSRAAGPVALALLVISIAVGFAAAFEGVDEHCERTAPDGFFCKSHKTECTQTKHSFCDTTVRDLAAVYWGLLIATWPAIIFAMMRAEEVAWRAETAADADADAPMLVTLHGAPGYGYPVSIHMGERHLARLQEHLSRVHFNAEFRAAAFRGFGALAEPAVTGNKRAPLH